MSKKRIQPLWVNLLKSVSIIRRTPNWAALSKNGCKITFDHYCNSILCWITLKQHGNTFFLLKRTIVRKSVYWWRKKRWKNIFPPIFFANLPTLFEQCLYVVCTKSKVRDTYDKFVSEISWIKFTVRSITPTNLIYTVTTTFFKVPLFYEGSWISLLS